MTRRLLRSQGGFTYIAVLVMVIILGITLGSAATFWGTRMKRERETELLFRGIQYRDAIRGWYGFVWDDKNKVFKKDLTNRARLGLGTGEPPPLMDLEQLTKDPNSGGKVRWLRRLYPDPVKSFETGKEEKWAVVKEDPSGRIIGVKSASEQKPLKQGVFPDDPQDGLNPQDFEAKEKYSDWQFIYNRFPQPAAAGGASGAGVINTPGSPAPSSTWKGFTLPR